MTPVPTQIFGAVPVEWVGKLHGRSSSERQSDQSIADILELDEKIGYLGVVTMENDETHDGIDKNSKREDPLDIIFIGTVNIVQPSI